MKMLFEGLVLKPCLCFKLETLLQVYLKNGYLLIELLNFLPIKVIEVLIKFIFFVSIEFIYLKRGFPKRCSIFREQKSLLAFYPY
jgi:hypothetical protein